MASPGPFVACQRCGCANPEGSSKCSQCGARLIGGAQTVTNVLPEGWSPAPATPITPQLVPGAVIAGRYEIVAPLGSGGMGTVYKVLDRELKRVVALKVIRADLAGDPDVLQRFKRELLLAQQVTHRNAVRVFDFGTDGDLKFITMEFVEGRDLAALVAERRFTEAESIRIARQVAAALTAAHAAGVVHRDLKPQNIIVGAGGKVSVMDFGLARSDQTAGGFTRTGAILGTPLYMSPEQARGAPADKRSDIFSLGMIFYELLTGEIPFDGSSVTEILLKRGQEPAPPPRRTNPSVSERVDGVVQKCVEFDPDQRYQSAADLLRDLEILDTPTDSSAASSSRPARQLSTMGGSASATIPSDSKASRWKVWASIGAVALISVAWVARGRFGGEGGARHPAAATVAIADFRNETGDQWFNGRIETMLRIALEEAPFLDVAPRDQSAAGLTEEATRQAAAKAGVEFVVNGVIRPGKISVTALQAGSGRTIGSAEAAFGSRDTISIDQLAAKLRAALGDRAPGSGAKATPDAAAAARLYQAAAATYERGNRELAAEQFRAAREQAGRMSSRDRMRTLGGYYLATLDPTKAIEQFSALVEQYPNDAAAHASLASAWYLLHEGARAADEMRRALAIYPKNARYRGRLAWDALCAGQPDVAAREAIAAPEDIDAALALALSQVMQGQVAAAEETYRKLQSVGREGASAATAGLADLALYQGRAADAAILLERGVADDLSTGNPAAAARKLLAMAHAQTQLGQKPEAAAAIGRALELSRGACRFPAGLAWVEAGQDDKALALAGELRKRTDPFGQAFAKIVEAEVEMRRGNAQTAVRLVVDAQPLSDMWLARFALGRAYLAAKAYPQADTELEACLRRRGEAADAFLDGGPAYRLAPAVYYFLGAAREGLNAGDSAEFYRTFLATKAPGAVDPMITEARRRLGAQ